MPPGNESYETPASPPRPHAHNEPAVPRTPGASATPRSIVHRTPPDYAYAARPPAYPPRTPGPGHSGSPSVTTCSADVDVFLTVTVHTAKCSECDKRNSNKMRRCPGCTFQLCKVCCDRRERAGRTLAHGNMVTPTTVTPRTGGSSVVRKRPEAVVKQEMDEDMDTGVKKEDEVEGGQTPVKLKLLLKSPGDRMGEQPPVGKKRSRKNSNSEESSADEATPDSPTLHKRRRTVMVRPLTGAPTTRATRKPPPSTVVNDIAKTEEPADLSSAMDVDTAEAAEDVIAESAIPKIAPRDPRYMTLEELLQNAGINTPENQYKEHLLSRHIPVTADPVIHMPANVQRSFKPRPTALEIQQSIQDKVRQKLKAQEGQAAPTVRSFIKDVAVTYRQSVSLNKDQQDEFEAALKELARKWAIQAHLDMVIDGQMGVIRGLDMRLESLDTERMAVLAGVIVGCAERKLLEFARENESSQEALQVVA